jgi:hypothetical protein
MKVVTIAVLLGIVSSPAQACHRFSHWYYPKPQQCRVTTIAYLKPQKEDKNWYVEIILTPEVMDEISRGIGIEKIKELYQKKEEK